MAGAVDQTHRTRGLFDNVQPNCLVIELAVDDRDTVDELCSYPAGPEREAFAIHALRIGVLALRQARGRLDVDLIQRETQRMLAGLQNQLNSHSADMHSKLAGSLKEYFDPQSGRFQERVQQLVKQDGELEQVLRRQIGGTDSELARTLVAHVGQESPLIKLLDPNQSRGLLQALRETVETQLTAQRTHVLKEFSLDNKEGALARLVGELSANHGQIAKVLGEKVDHVVREFSLDEENSALSRLVRNVDRAQRTISLEFSLDNENSALSRLAGILDSTKKAIDGQLTLDGESSALARLRRELLTILDTHAKNNGDFQEEVKVTLAKMAARREEAAKSTRHGLDFEEAVCSFVEFHTQRAGDVAERHRHAHRADQELQGRRRGRRAGAGKRGPGGPHRHRSQGGRGLHAGQGPGRNRASPQEPRCPGRPVRALAPLCPRGDRGSAALRRRRVRALGPRRRAEQRAPQGRADDRPRAVHPGRTPERGPGRRF